MMASNNQQAAIRFSTNLDRFVTRRTQQSARDRFMRIVFEATYKLLDRSPVDTGFFRSQWSIVVSPNVPALRPSERPEGYKGGSEPDIAGSLGTINFTTRVWIVNPTAYGPRLENGHSSQAPHGLVGITADEIREKYGI